MSKSTKHPAPHPDPLAAKLARPEGATALADRWLADLFDSRVDLLIPPAAAARAIHEALSALAASDGAEALLVQRAEAVLDRYQGLADSLGERMPEPLAQAAVRFAKRPHQPHRELVLKVLDREPVRQLIRVLLMDALVEFGRKLAAPISGSRVGKGLGALGSLAGAVGAGVLGAVGGELEKQVERKASEFADSALSRVLQNLVEMISDPRRASEQGELRAALVEGALEIPVKQLVAEARRANPRALAAELRGLVQQLAQRPDAERELKEALERALEPVQGRTVREELQALGLLELAERTGRELLVPRIQAFDWAGAFEAIRES